MAVTATLVFAAKNRVRYLLAQDGAAGTTVTITTTGGATPDLRTDLAGGLLEQIANVVNAGYGAFAAGAQTQAKARALFLEDNSVSTPGDASVVPTARCRLTPRVGAAGTALSIDANVDGGGNPTLTVTADAAASSAYLDIEIPGMIGA